MKNVLILIIAALLLTSCYTQRTKVGKFEETKGVEYTYAKGKQIWLFWGLIPVGRTNVNTPDNGICEVVTRTNITDLLIKGLTGGIVTTRTTKIIAKEVQEKQQEIKSNNSQVVISKTEPTQRLQEKNNFKLGETVSVNYKNKKIQAKIIELKDDSVIVNWYSRWDGDHTLTLFYAELEKLNQ